LFAVSMLVLAIFYPRKFSRSTSVDASRFLLHKLRTVTELRLYHRPLEAALLGKYSTAKAMKYDIVQELMKKQTVFRRKHKETKHRRRSIIEAFLIVSLASIYFIISLFI